jgi:hypothetical protein
MQAPSELSRARPCLRPRFQDAPASREIAEEPAEDAPIPVSGESQPNGLCRVGRTKSDMQPRKGEIDLADLEEEDLADLGRSTDFGRSTYLRTPNRQAEGLPLHGDCSGRSSVHRNHGAPTDDLSTNRVEILDHHACRDGAGDLLRRSRPRGTRQCGGCGECADERSRERGLNRSRNTQVPPFRPSISPEERGQRTLLAPIKSRSNAGARPSSRGRAERRPALGGKRRTSVTFYGLADYPGQGVPDRPSGLFPQAGPVPVDVG